MKKIFVLTLLALSLLFSSCGGDDNGDCVQADFIGTYVGTMTIAGVATDSTFEVTAVGNNKITVEDAQSDIDIKGCKIEGGTTAFGTGLEYSGSLEGDEITINESFKALGVDAVTTTWNGVRQ